MRVLIQSDASSVAHVVDAASVGTVTERENATRFRDHEESYPKQRHTRRVKSNRQDCGPAVQRVSSSNGQGRKSSAGPGTVR